MHVVDAVIVCCACDSVFICFARWHGGSRRRAFIRACARATLRAARGEGSAARAHARRAAHCYVIFLRVRASCHGTFFIMACARGMPRARARHSSFAAFIFVSTLISMSFFVPARVRTSLLVSTLGEADYSGRTEGGRIRTLRARACGIFASTSLSRAARVIGLFDVRLPLLCCCSCVLHSTPSRRLYRRPLRICERHLAAPSSLHYFRPYIAARARARGIAARVLFIWPQPRHSLTSFLHFTTSVFGTHAWHCMPYLFCCCRHLIFVMRHPFCARGRRTAWRHCGEALAVTALCGSLSFSSCVPLIIFVMRIRRYHRRL